MSWGAEAKVRQLDEMYPRLRTEELPPSPTSTIEAPVEQLELATVIKVSQAVSSQIVLENLLETVLKVALEQAGAERGLLILPQNVPTSSRAVEGEQYRIEAEIKSGPDQVSVQLCKAPVSSAELPDSLLRYVIRTHEHVVLDDASSQNLFSEDEYIKQRCPRSILCLPLVKQTWLIGVLFLENNLAPRVFTPKRLAMLQLLASQAAVSLDHVQLYADLRRSEAFLAQGQKISHTGSWGWRVSSGDVYWSKEHFRIFDYNPETTKPSYSSFMGRVHPEDRPEFEQVLEQAVREKSDFEHDYRILLT
jgi:transcriptional regulator with GAF, ATPase, and Fis domain